MAVQPYKTRLYSLGTDPATIAWANRGSWRGQGIFLDGEDIDVPNGAVAFPPMREQPADLAAAMRALGLGAAERAAVAPDDGDALMPTRHSDGAYETDGAQAIYDAVRTRILTRVGTREYRPDFGVDMVGTLGGDLDSAAIAELSADIAAALDEDVDWYSSEIAPPRIDGEHVYLDVRCASEGLNAPVNFSLRLA